MEVNRVGEFMCTFTGKTFFPLDPRPDEICVEDIAHQLAQENRFNGALPEPCSVAQHSVLVSHLVQIVFGGTPAEQKQGLFHDSPEAYVKDLHRPLKRALASAYNPIEHGVWLAVAEKFGINAELSPMVKQADDLCLSLERRDLFPASHQQLWQLRGIELAPKGYQIAFIDWRDAERAFLRRYYEIEKALHG